MNKMPLTIIAAAGLSACGAINSQSIETQNQTPIQHVCIIQNNRADLPQWPLNLAASLKKHHISSTMVTDPRSPLLQQEQCRFTLRYNVITPRHYPNTLRRATIRIIETTASGRHNAAAVHFKLRGNQRQYIQNPNLQAQTDDLIDSMFR